jgi:hypothetical protein
LKVISNESLAAAAPQASDLIEIRVAGELDDFRLTEDGKAIRRMARAPAQSYLGRGPMMFGKSRPPSDALRQ